MLTEKIMEDVIAENPEKYLGEEGLILLKRQPIFGKYRFDLLFENRHGIKLIVEIKLGTLDRKHRDKVLDYQYEYKKRNLKDFVDVMVIANKIPSESREILRYRGIDFKEIREADFPIKSHIENQPKLTNKTTNSKFKYPKNISDNWDRTALNDVEKWLRNYISLLPVGKPIKVDTTARQSRDFGHIKPRGNSDGIRHLLKKLGDEGTLDFPDTNHFVVIKKTE